MPRKGWIPRREVKPDSVYGSDLVQKFINSMMWDGKRSTAQRIFYGAMEQIGKKAHDEPLKVFKKAIDNIKPTLEVKSRRVGGSNYQVPVEVRPERRTSLSLRWLVPKFLPPGQAPTVTPFGLHTTEGASLGL